MLRYLVVLVKEAYGLLWKKEGTSTHHDKKENENRNRKKQPILGYFTHERQWEAPTQEGDETGSHLGGSQTQ